VGSVRVPGPLGDFHHPRPKVGKAHHSIRLKLEAPPFCGGHRENMLELRVDGSASQGKEEQLVATDDALSIPLDFSADQGQDRFCLMGKHALF
jgi:hypothetical protein